MPSTELNYPRKLSKFLVVHHAEIPKGLKTPQFWVASPEGRYWLAAERLGVVRWYSPFRGFAFFPEAGTVFEEDCLRHIAGFCEEMTTWWKKDGRYGRV